MRPRIRKRLAAGLVALSAVAVALAAEEGFLPFSRYDAETGWTEAPGEHRWLSNEPIRGIEFLYADEGTGWNDPEITAQGMRVKSGVNGVTAVDHDGSGVLDDELRLEDLRLKEL